MLTEENVLFGHTDEESAYVVEDYPYGFRLRTTIRYWLETTKRGDRFCSQTLNPKTDRWNKPKRSTYCPVGAMFLDEEGHVTWAGLNTWADEEAIANFEAVLGDELTKAQRLQVAQLRGQNKAMEGVTFSIVENPTPEQTAEINRNDARLAQRMAVNVFQAKQEADEDFGDLADWKAEQRRQGFRVR